MEIFIVDTFTAVPFKGNPAAVCLADEMIDETRMQAVATEMNLSETAFIHQDSSHFDLRWFTPTTEVPLCGHATLASAHILWNTDRVKKKSPIYFNTKGGVLVSRIGQSRIEIEFPAVTFKETLPPSQLFQALGNIKPRFSGITESRGDGDIDYLLELESEEAIRCLKPDFTLLCEIPFGVIATARADHKPYDFVSRYFAPSWGINEDPVTGVAHCSLVPYWGTILNKTKLLGYQASKRGGYVYAQIDNNCVTLSGEACTVMQGTLLA